MKVIPLAEGWFTVDKTKQFVPFDASSDQLRDRPAGSLLVEIQPFVVCTANDVILLDTSGGFSISNNTYTIVNWDSEVFDTDAFHSTSSNTSRVTIPTGKSGKYQVTVNMPWDWNASGYRRFAIKLNGSSNARFCINSAQPNSTTAEAKQSWTGVMDVTAGQYYELELYQTSGTALGTFAGIAWGEWTWIYLGA